MLHRYRNLQLAGANQPDTRDDTYQELMSSHYNLDFITHLKEWLDSLFGPHKLDWTSIQFANKIAALKLLNSGKVMTVITT